MPEERYKNTGYNQKRRLKKVQMHRQVRKTQKRLNRLRAFYKLFLIIIMIFLILFILKMPQWRLKSDAFNTVHNPSLEIVNNHIVPSHKVLSALRRNNVPQKPIFLVRTDNLKNCIEQLEPVQEVYIRRFWNPARLQIHIVERTPVVQISPEINVPPIAFFSSDGKLIGREYMPIDNSYDTVLVITYGKDDDYRNWDAKKVNNFSKLAKVIETETGEKVEYIDYRNPKDVYVKIKTTTIRLGPFTPVVFQKISRLPSLLPQVKMLNQGVKYIDLRWDTNYIKLGENNG